jgi:hypothetical protein
VASGGDLKLGGRMEIPPAFRRDGTPRRCTCERVAGRPADATRVSPQTRRGASVLRVRSAHGSRVFGMATVGCLFALVAGLVIMKILALLD